jgi:hypothetical protein
MFMKHFQDKASARYENCPERIMCQLVGRNDPAKRANHKTHEAGKLKCWDCKETHAFTSEGEFKSVRNKGEA